MKERPKIRPLVLPEKKLFLLTNGKCGGTSLHRWLFTLLDKPLMSRGFFNLAKNFSIEFAFKFSFIKIFRREVYISDKDEDFRRFISFYRSWVCEKWLDKLED